MGDPGSRRSIVSNTSIHFHKQFKQNEAQNMKSMRGMPVSIHKMEKDGLDEKDQFIFAKMKKLKNLFNTSNVIISF
jgi:hypothetical protein